MTGFYTSCDSKLHCAPVLTLYYKLKLAFKLKRFWSCQNWKLSLKTKHLTALLWFCYFHSHFRLRGLGPTHTAWCSGASTWRAPPGSGARCRQRLRSSTLCRRARSCRSVSLFLSIFSIHIEKNKFQFEVVALPGSGPRISGLRKGLAYRLGDTIRWGSIDNFMNIFVGSLALE